MRAALSAGIPIQTFWRLSLVEWRWLAAAHQDDEAMSVSQLSALIETFPDQGDEYGRVRT